MSSEQYIYTYSNMYYKTNALKGNEANISPMEKKLIFPIKFSGDMWVHLEAISEDVPPSQLAVAALNARRDIFGLGMVSGNTSLIINPLSFKFPPFLGIQQKILYFKGCKVCMVARLTSPTKNTLQYMILKLHTLMVFYGNLSSKTLNMTFHPKKNLANSRQIRAPDVGNVTVSKNICPLAWGSDGGLLAQ